jgi:hypothetical protein
MKWIQRGQKLVTATCSSYLGTSSFTRFIPLLVVFFVELKMIFFYMLPILSKFLDQAFALFELEDF